MSDKLGEKGETEIVALKAKIYSYIKIESWKISTVRVQKSVLLLKASFLINVRPACWAVKQYTE